MPGARGLLRDMSHGRVLLQIPHEERRLSEEDLQVGKHVMFRLSILVQYTVGVIVRNILPFFADVCQAGIASHSLMQNESYLGLPVYY